MMEPFERIDIQELPLSVPTFRRKVEDFLGSNGLRLGEVDLYMAVLADDGALLAGGGLQRDIIKCLAVSPAARSMGLSVPLISRLISVASERGFTNVKVFTKPENQAMFESLGFKLLASAPKAILMENGRGLEDYCAYLRQHRAAGVIVMNANPFTLGHAYLAEQAEQSGKLVIIPVKEEASRFPYEERVKMMKGYFGRVVEVLEGSDYQISAATFPTYFLKDLSDAAETQMRLDIDLFGRHIAPALGATARFVGSEPEDALTARYNALMQEMLPAYGVQVVEIPRLIEHDVPVSASRVRAALDRGSFREAAEMVPDVGWRFLKAELAERALRMEADLTPKPGLVDLDGSGAHADMDHATLERGIEALRPWFGRMASDVGDTSAEACERLRELGVAAEEAMLRATGGVNTHRGAIFALGLALAAGVPEMLHEEEADERLLAKRIARLAAWMGGNPYSHGARIRREYPVRGALQMAREGYPELFARWLPYYRSVKDTPFGLHRTLLLIISELDDTCVIHRAGYARAQQVKAEAKALLAVGGGSTGSPTAKVEIAGQAGNDGRVMPDLIGHLKELGERYAAEGISPGGAADMLALTLFVDSILH